jgi:hypothetical protein
MEAASDAARRVRSEPRKPDPQLLPIPRLAVARRFGGTLDPAQIEATLDIAYDTVSGRFLMPMGDD